MLDGLHQIDLVGHRVVHGGLEFGSATLVTPDVETTIDRLSELAPLHNPANLEGIRACREALGESVPQFAVFDTVFHRTLPEAATVYPGPNEWVGQGLVRYKARENDRRATLAMDVFIHRLRAGIGSMLASLGGLDALVFTDVIGETEPIVRRRICDAFAFLGLRLDDDLNASSPRDADIAAAGPSVRVVIVQSQENWQIAAEAVGAWHSQYGQAP